MPKIFSFDDLIKLILLKHDSRFEVFKAKGKDSHRTLYQPDINGITLEYLNSTNGIYVNGKKITTQWSTC